jgi:serine/threonine-protein kinase HipA
VSKDKEIFVYAQWVGMVDPLPIGTLRSQDARGKELFEFRFNESWLKNHSHVMLDPQLQLFSGSFFPKGDAQNFGMFSDSAPGIWGKELMQKYETALARKAKRAPQKLSESDFLLGVFDFYRSGALRFKTSIEGEFVTSDEQFILPSLSSLRELEHTSMRLNEESFSGETFSSLETLAAAGAVLGGKRPKATVIDNDWQMWIAKFPQKNDVVDVGGWEFVAHTMAGLAGIQTSPSMIRKLNTSHHTFMAQRFDRTMKGERIHFATANTLLGFGKSNVVPGYLDIAGFLMQHGADVNSDLEELWRRMVFNIAIKNTDDHLNNHGFLLTNEGWKLSPVYDLNPEAEGNGLSLNISEHENSLCFDLAMSVASYFRVKPEKAKSIIREINLVKDQWNKIAADAGLTKAEQERMSGAFE